MCRYAVVIHLFTADATLGAGGHGVARPNGDKRLFIPARIPTASSTCRSKANLVDIATCLSTDTLISLIRLTTTMTSFSGAILTVVGNGIRIVRSRRELLGSNCPQKR